MTGRKIRRMAAVWLPFQLLLLNHESGETDRHEAVGRGDSSTHLSAKTLPSAKLSRATASYKLPRLSLATPPPTCRPCTSNISTKNGTATEVERIYFVALVALASFDGEADVGVLRCRCHVCVRSDRGQDGMLRRRQGEGPGTALETEVGQRRRRPTRLTRCCRFCPPPETDGEASHPRRCLQLGAERTAALASTSATSLYGLRDIRTTASS